MERERGERERDKMKKYKISKSIETDHDYTSESSSEKIIDEMVILFSTLFYTLCGYVINHKTFIAIQNISQLK